jgi:Taurine catabolism dioxygenase TauD, TfdA family
MSEAIALPPPPLPPGPILGPQAWYGRDMVKRSDWIIHFTPRDLAELDAAVQAHRAGGKQLGEITPENFRLPTLAPKLQQALDELLNGRGFLVFRGFQIDPDDIEAAAIAYLGVGSHLGSFRSQNAKGHLLGHVKDLGLDISDPKVRYYQTTRELEYHTDSCDVVGLLCLKTAKEGGESRLCSSTTLYNEVLKRRPDLLPLLFNPFPTDRRGEVPSGMKPWFDMPVFHWHEGKLSAIYSGQYIRSAQQNFPEAPRLTSQDHAAIDLLDSLANDPEINLKVEFRPGDMQFVHNHTMLHSRGDFVNWPEPERHRHLLRLWLAPKQARPLPAVYAQRYGSVEPGNRGGIVCAETVLKFTLRPE